MRYIWPEYRTKSKTTVKWSVFWNSLQCFRLAHAFCVDVAHTQRHSRPPHWTHSLRMYCVRFLQFHPIKHDFYRILMHSNVLMASVFFLLLFSVCPILHNRIFRFIFISNSILKPCDIVPLVFACFRTKFAHATKFMPNISKQISHLISSNCWKRSHVLWREFKFESFVLKQWTVNPVLYLHISF